MLKFLKKRQNSSSQPTKQEYSNYSYSLEGEDLILWRFLNNKPSGFYVDIGTYHPFQHSNSYFFHCQGWRGININATPGSMDAFKKHRPRDTNLEVAISDPPGTKTFYMFEDSSLNSLNETLSKDRISRGFRLKQMIEVESRTLAEILSVHLPANTAIDFLNIDVEGFELEVLRSNDWNLFRPLFIIAEVSAFGRKNGLTTFEAGRSEVGRYLKSQGYHLVAKTFDFAIFSTETCHEDFLDNGLWTPQTSMMRAIQAWILDAECQVERVLSIDNNPTFDLLVRQKWPEAVIERAVYPEQNAMDLAAYPDNSFDLVYSHQVLEHIPKPWLAANEMTRVLKPGGIGIHTTCAFNPRHGPPAFQDYYRFLPEGLAQLFDNVDILEKGEWGNKEAILYNVGVDDGHATLGGRRFSEAIGAKNDGLYPWATWIVFHKSTTQP